MKSMKMLKKRIVALIVLVIVVAIIVAVVVAVVIGNKTSARLFPQNFKFGVATSSYQIEGAWNADGKGENIWDNICHTNPNFTENQDNGDISCNSYYLYEQDVQLLSQLGVHYYRFSLSWSRILPSGLNTQINPAGISYYRNLINLLLENGIEPMVTIYHWDLPQPLQEIGGWLNPDLETIFADYAKVAFEQFGDKVKTWITLNEPIQICGQGYGTGTMAPGIQSGTANLYRCAHTLIKAHARAWHTYDTQFRPQQKGRISITIDTSWMEPGDPQNVDDIKAAERALQFTYGWYANPIYNRNYPQIMIDAVGNRSALEGFEESRLPSFTEEELDYISGTYDFMGFNTYTTYLVKPEPEGPADQVNYWYDRQVNTYQDPTWETGASSWLKVTPWGIRKLLNWLKNTYHNPEIIITENGYSDTGELDDAKRISYYKSYLSNVLDAILDDDVNVSAYTAWSLLDNFEWAQGYSEKFGLFHVNFSDPERTRMAKSSAHYYARVIETRNINHDSD